MLKLSEASNRHLTQSLKLFLPPKSCYYHLPFSYLYIRRQTLMSNPAIDFVLDVIEERKLSEPIDHRTKFTPEPVQRSGSRKQSLVQISHPWREWVELMEHLKKRGYLEGIGDVGGKEYNQIRTACLNFARDHADLIRCFSRKDIWLLVGSGCPSVDRKVVNSGKRLRAHVGIDEGNVCSTCSLRGNCERAYMKVRDAQDVRVGDIMRLLITYRHDPLTDYVVNKQCLNKKVQQSARRLLREMMEFTKEPSEGNPSEFESPVKEKSTHQAKEQANAPMKRGNWICLNCNLLNSSRNVNCTGCYGLSQEASRELGADQDHHAIKKGDWICEKCNFLNFAKNTRCLHCKEKPPRRPLNLGEWECESCNYINFRRNMACMKCDHKRPKASTTARSSAQPEWDHRLKHIQSYL